MDVGSAENPEDFFCLNIAAFAHPCVHATGYPLEGYTVHPPHMDVGSADNARAYFLPEHRRSYASLRPRHTVHPEHKHPGRTQGGWVF